MSKKLWSTGLAVLVGAAMLLTPSTSEAQLFRGGWGGGVGRGWGWNGIGMGLGSPGYYGGYSGWNRPYFGGYTYGYPSSSYSYPAYNYSYSYPAYDYTYSYPVYSNQSFVTSPQTTFADNLQGGNTGQSSFYPGFTQNGLTNPNDAGFILRVPDPNAEVLFGNYQTQQRGIIREYETAQPLQPNQVYTFQIHARWMQNGKPVEQTRQVQARAGQNITVDFAGPNAGPMPNQQFQNQQNPQFYPQGQFQGQQFPNQNLNNPNLPNPNAPNPNVQNPTQNPNIPNPNAPNPNVQNPNAPNPAVNPNQAPNPQAPNPQNPNERLPNPPTKS